jgi:DNA-binding transcriptional MerR regulator
VQLERRLIARLNIRFTDAQIERIWAIVSAHEAGLSIRKIASATGLSSSRIHQLLNAPEAKEIPVWLSQLQQSSGGSGRKEKAHRPEPETEIRSRLAREVQVLRRCTEWLQRLERGENVVVNLRPDEDVETGLSLSIGRGWSACWNESQPTWITSAWCRMTRTRTKNRTTMILEDVIAMSWPSRHGSQRS